MPLKPASASILALAACAALAAPAAAQNSAEPPVVTAPPPKSDTPPSTTTPPATPPVVVTEPAPAPVVVVPQSAPAAPPMEPVTIDPDAAYPNGFGDPLDPNSTNVALDYQRRGFDWGLLGLLGLLGLIPLFRDRGGRRVVYVERDESPPRRVVREERIDDRP